ncbi:MAG: histidine phosphatase family protein [Syntrophomonadaceae bacterium]|jgi:broad specificity phosphatase PhoE
MRIGLVRHFPATRGFPHKLKLLTLGEFFQWLDEYEISDIEYGQVNLGGIKFRKCFSSDLPRAVKTARLIYDGKIITMKALREFHPQLFIKRNLKLPFFLWIILARLSWLINHKTLLKSKQDFQQRVRAALDEILLTSDDDILIVSHGVLMFVLRQELLRKGFTGPKFKIPSYGKLYLFQRVQG